MAQIRTSVRVTANGKSVDAIALFDTGAEAYAFLDYSISQKLGLTQGGARGYSGIAGDGVGFDSVVDSLSLIDNPMCTVTKNVPVIVGRVTVPNVTLLIGEYFTTTTKMIADFSSGKFAAGCKGGPTIAIGQPIPTEYWIIGGAAAAILIAVMLFGSH